MCVWIRAFALAVFLLGYQPFVRSADAAPSIGGTWTVRLTVVGKAQPEAPLVVSFELRNLAHEPVTLPWRSLSKRPPELRLSVVSEGQEHAFSESGRKTELRSTLAPDAGETALFSCFTRDDGSPILPNGGDYEARAVITLPDGSQAEARTSIQISPSSETDRKAKAAIQTWLSSGTSAAPQTEFPWGFWWKLLTVQRVDEIGGRVGTDALLAASMDSGLRRVVAASEVWRDLFELACGRLAYLRLRDLGESADIAKLPIESIRQNTHFKMAREHFEGLTKSNVAFARKEAIWLLIRIDFIERDYGRCEEHIREYLKSYGNTADSDFLRSILAEIQDRRNR